MPRPKRRDPFRVFYRSDKKCWVVEFGHGEERGQRNAPVTIGGREAAVRWARENFGDQIPIKRDTQSCEALFDRWTTERWREARRAEPRFSPATVANNESHGKKWIKVYFKGVPLSTIGTPEIRAFVRHIRDSGRGQQTVRNVFYTLLAFFDDVMAEGWVKIATNPARHPAVLKEVPKLEKQRGGEGVVTIPFESAAALINGDPVPIFRRAKYAIHFTLGIRPGEGPGLQVGDVDLVAETIAIERQVANYSPSRAATGVRPPKRKSRRLLPLHTTAVAAIRDWLAEWEIFVGRNPKGGDPLFPDAEGGHYRGRQADDLRTDLEALGLPTSNDMGVPFTLQAARRSVSSWLRSADVPKETRGRLLGHAAEGVTDEHYTDADVEHLRRAVAKLAFTWTPMSAVSGVDCAAPIAAPVSASVTYPTTSEQESCRASFGTRTRDLRFTKQETLQPQALATADQNANVAGKSTDPQGHHRHEGSGPGSVIGAGKGGFAATIFDDGDFAAVVAEHGVRAQVAVLRSRQSVTTGSPALDPEPDLGTSRERVPHEHGFTRSGLVDLTPAELLAMAAAPLLNRSVHWVTVRRRKGSKRDAG